MSAWTLVGRTAIDAVREYFTPLRAGWTLIFVGLGLLAMDALDIILWLVR